LALGTAVLGVRGGPVAPRLLPSTVTGRYSGATSIADIEKLMAELLVARDFLQSEGDRIRRINANYRHLAETASASVKVITETIGKWRISDEPANQASKVIGHLRPQAQRG